MLLKERVMDPKALDEISEVLAYTEYAKDADGNRVGEGYRVVPMYFYHWYPNNLAKPGYQTLKERTLGAHSKDHVGFTRYYPTTTPKIVVDFEPAPPDLFWEEQKRQFCTELMIAYVPVYLGDRLDESMFKERVKAAKDIAMAGNSVVLQDEALQSVTGVVPPPVIERYGTPQRQVEEWMQDPELIRLLDQRAIQMVEDDQIRNNKRYRGMSRAHMLKRYKQQLMDEVRKGLKSGRIVDPVASYREPASATG